MTYHLTPTQRAGIVELTQRSVALGLPDYYAMINGIAAVLTGLRENDKGATERGRKKLHAALECLRNESASPLPTTVPRTRSKPGARPQTISEMLHR